MRIVSLLASATELVFALGKGESLVGRSHECDYPQQVDKLTCCTQPAFSLEGASADIDRAVKTAARNALSIYRVNELELERLAPDLILTQTQCEVCAVSLQDVEAALAKSLRRDCRVVALNPHDLADVLADVDRVAAALDARAAGFELRSSMRQRLGALAARVQLFSKPTVAVLEWLDPLLAAGHWIPELVDAAGGRDLFGPVGAKGPWLSLDRLMAADPDVIVAAPCGFPMSRSQPELTGLIARPDWSSLRAVRQKRVYVADGNAFFNRPGPRLAETAEILAEILHPDLTPKHENWAWRRLA